MNFSDEQKKYLRRMSARAHAALEDVAEKQSEKANARLDDLLREIGCLVFCHVAPDLTSAERRRARQWLKNR